MALTWNPPKRAHILVADDNDLNRGLLRRLLERRGYDVTEAIDGQAVLEMAEAGPPDLVLLDLVMPDISGLEVLRQLRHDYDASTLPVIMVTAARESDAAAACFDAGANDYVTKPIQLEILCARLRTHLGLHLAHLELADHAHDEYWRR